MQILACHFSGNSPLTGWKSRFAEARGGMKTYGPRRRNVSGGEGTGKSGTRTKRRLCNRQILNHLHNPGGNRDPNLPLDPTERETPMKNIITGLNLEGTASSLSSPSNIQRTAAAGTFTTSGINWNTSRGTAA
ncbi:hypothetical protein Pcinc_012357 [Petrolisthes cinctipes]|uniref:Uncharacterized protein n=1 Tax=Petrolisthes cinctipes TaxID=88211 RepID=A0AAE1G1D2_PETCI|nr:hypothetical protein Pcinc_012357 [Petrolisthes cinctipes]